MEGTRITSSAEAVSAELESHALAFSQHRLWFQEQLVPGSAAYHIHLAFRLTGTVDIDAMRSALTEIVRRNEILRTTIVADGGRPRSIVNSPYDPLAVLDMRQRNDPDAAALAIVAEESVRPFDLGKGPMMRVHLVRVDEARWILLFVIHHIVFDWFSERVMGEELSTLYAAAVEGMAEPEPTSRLQFHEFVQWQRASAHSKVLDRKVQYWRKSLAGLGAPLELHPDRPRPEVLSFAGRSTSVTIEPVTTTRLRKVARDHRSTLFATLLSGFSAFLARYSGQEDVVVGTPTAGRTRRDLQNVVGCFVNVVPMRTMCPPDATLAELTKASRRTVMGAVANQDVPFERLVDTVAPGRSASRNPLFQITFESRPERTAEIAIRLPGVEVTPVEGEAVGTRFDLEVTIRESSETLQCTAVYSPELFDAGTIESLLAGFTTFLAAAAEGPDRPIAELPMVPAAERARLTSASSPAAEVAPPENTVVSMVQEMVDRFPSATAIQAGDHRLTYRELDGLSGRIASALLEAGIGPDDVVGVCLPRGADLVAALLGVLRSGGAYLPLDPGEPPARLAAMLEDAQCRVAIATGSMANLLPSDLALLDPASSSVALTALPSPASSHLAYVIFTSGSTGRPKGVAVEHVSLANLVRWQCRQYGLGPSVRASQLASIAFDAAVWEIWPVLSAGGTLVIGEPDPVELDRWLKVQRIDLAFLVTPLAEQLFRMGVRTSLSQPMLVGGSRLTRRPPAGVAVVNHYGPTECAVVATSSPVEPDGVGEPDIGRPIDNAAVYVLDERQELLPAGAVGEIVIGGAGVARGYLADPGLTAERFLCDPFRPGGRMYRTGDLGRLRSDCSLQFIGRSDDQVKVRGHRVELGEVEAVLRAHRDLEQVAVVAVDDPTVGIELVGHLVPTAAASRADSQALVDDVRSFSTERLPGPMVPSRFVVSDGLPMNERGKVDRPGLATLSLRQEASASGQQVGTETERRLGDIWAAALGLDRVDVDADFFDIGGHSILAAEVVATVRAEFGVSLPLRTIFEAPTIAEFSSALEELTQGDTSLGEEDQW